MFETTIAGSLPKPSWLAETNRLWPQWKLAGDELAAAKADATLLAAPVRAAPARAMPAMPNATLRFGLMAMLGRTRRKMLFTVNALSVGNTGSFERAARRRGTPAAR